MKTYTRHKTPAEILMLGLTTKTKIGTQPFHQGSDYLIVHLPGPSTTIVPIMYNTVNGRFFYYTDDETSIDNFSSESLFDGQPWFNALLEFFYSDLPIAMTIPVTLNLPTSVIENLFTVTQNCNASHSENGAGSHGGELDIAGLLTMVAEDMAMTNSRPGSWEGAGMQALLDSHGYY